jgi:hypothetical protein
MSIKVRTLGMGLWPPLGLHHRLRLTKRDALLIRRLVPKVCVSLELVAQSFVRLRTQDEPDE